MLMTNLINLHVTSSSGWAEGIERKTIIIIYKNRSVPFHAEEFLSDWTEKEPYLLTF